MRLNEELKAYLDGELEPQHADEVRRAIADSPDLQKEVEMLKRIGTSFGHFKGGPTEGKAALLDKLAPGAGSPEPEGPKRKSWWSRNKLSFGLAASLFIVVSLVTLNQGKSRQVESAGAAEMSSGAASAPAMGAPREEAAFAERAGDNEAKLESGGAAMDMAPGATSAKRLSNTPETMRAEREVIQSGSMGLEVKNAQESLSLVSNIATSLGGYIDGSNFQKDPEGQATASAILKVPSARFESAQQQLRKLGEVTSENIQTDDVTKQAVAMRAEAEQLKRKIDALDSRLRRAKGSEAREIRERLDQLQGQQSYTKQQIKMIESQTAISTLAVTLTEKSTVALKKDEAWSDSAWNRAMNNFGAAATFLGAVAINILVFSPIWLPIALIIWFFNRKK